MVSATNGASIRKCDAVPEPLVRPFTPLVHSTLFVFIHLSYFNLVTPCACDYIHCLVFGFLHCLSCSNRLLYVMQLLFRKSQSYLASLLFKTRLSLQGLASRPSVPGWPPETGILGCENDAPSNHQPLTCTFNIEPLIFNLDLNLGLNE